jgi:16S rRNA (cytosine1402-N4)-methyltransferase
MNAPHISVMMAEVLAWLAPRAGGVYVDGTLGNGGYSRAILTAADCRVVALDRDPAAAPRARELEAEFGERFAFVEGNFGDMETLLAARGIAAVDGVVLDIGVSSMQLDRAERGFSFRADGPLDMRMAAAGRTAADIVNAAEEAELADILWRYGEERRSRRIARAIVVARADAPILRTLQLADIVAGCVRGEPGQHAATRTFQALRIEVNDELGELSRGLAAAERLLRAGGRLVVVAFHSLEDRIVKRFLDRRAGKGETVSRHVPEKANRPAPSFRLLHGGALKPSASEAERNPRARSARLRAAERTQASAWEVAA